jgi:hypothetical protein
MLIVAASNKSSARERLKLWGCGDRLTGSSCKLCFSMKAVRKFSSAVRRRVCGCREPYDGDYGIERSSFIARCAPKHRLEPRR